MPSYAYSLVILGLYGDGKLFKGHAVLEIMFSKDCRPNDVTYTALINAFENFKLGRNNEAI